MCLPAAAVAVGSLVVGAAGAGLTAYGQYKSGQAAKANARMEAVLKGEQAKISNFNADQIEMYGALNESLVTAVGGLNNKLTSTIADANLGLINATTDFNVGIITATTDFNVASAEGAARLLEARGELQSKALLAAADYADRQAEQTFEQGAQAERNVRAGYAQLKGAQRARLAANGVALDEGSALRIQSDTDYAADVDADVVRTNTINTAFGYRMQAVQGRASAEMASLEGKAGALAKRQEGFAAKIAGAVGVAQTKIEGLERSTQTKLTASVQILQTEMDTKINALNIRQNAKTDAWSARAQALGLTAQGAQAAAAARSINPALLAGTSLVTSASNLLSQYSGYQRSGVFGG